MKEAGWGGGGRRSCTAFSIVFQEFECEGGVLRGGGGLYSQK